ncbi:MAG: ATP-binding cassette domain-containing protein [Anaerolineaceae bacterium]|nr:ATP-binding cassette domain-containing protein [Anaerolineaceae bacterium]
MIEVKDIVFEYANSSPIFDHFSWSVDQGDAWAIIGPSGCGKSTLLYLLAGLRLPSSGSVSIDGEIVLHPRPKNGLIIQDYGLLPWANVRKNVSLGLDIRQFYGPDGKHAPLESNRDDMDVQSWLDRLGLSELVDKYPAQLSGGQRQRTAIARTLVLNPDLLLMDEPFSSLDAPTRESLQDLVQELWREQKLTLITVTHSIEEAAILGQKILLLEKPPNRSARIINNPDIKDPKFRQSDSYQKICQQLRESMQL